MLGSQVTKAAPRPRYAADLLERSLGRFRGDLTVADAAARGGLALADTEAGLRQLASTRGGHLKATERGEIIYSFPDGLVVPVEHRRARRILRAAGRALATAGRFVVRAWVSVVLVGYALVFLAILIGLAARDDDGDGIGGALALVGRVLLEALYWTFHPFSPVAFALEPAWARRRVRGPARVPFYERVNRFVFGPPEPVAEPLALERDVVAEIRRLGARVGPEDVMRVTGQDREAAERTLLRLVVDHDGDIQVDENGAILYVFRALRPTASAPAAAARPAVAPIWTRRVSARAVTGNRGGTNAFLVGLNGFNLALSGAAVAAGVTVERLGDIAARLGADAAALGPLPPAHGVPLLLGWIPLLFSAGLFLLPLGRLLGRRREAARAARENGRRSLLALVVHEETGRAHVAPAEAERAWKAAAGASPARREVEAAARALGGEVDLAADGTIVYRFDAGGREREALARARAAADAAEAAPGRVIFSSDN